ncbi:MAG: amidohydrolase family protein [Acidobacteria bacterium]|nr:amidohydrolase family protein [Acidobacteriota bacterium]MBI3661442.1 amidohydrolase family protein [Acidobacteriota bacterium]
MSRKNIGLFLLMMMLCAGLCCCAKQRKEEGLLLGGTVITPDRVIHDGWVLIQRGRIRSVHDTRPDFRASLEIKINGIILPGLIDVHNHPMYGVFPRWNPPAKFENRYGWRDSPEYKRLIGDPGRELQNKDEQTFCDMEKYGEARALIGGTTAFVGVSPRASLPSISKCVIGLVRNLDWHSDFVAGHEIGREKIENLLGVQPRDLNDNRLKDVLDKLQNQKLDTLLVHVAEGRRTDANSKSEFAQLEQKGLLTAHTGIIHGIALTPLEFLRMKEVGASLIWSPTSNVNLYGETTDIPAAVKAGVTLALAPDWSVTGSSNMLDELRFAGAWDQSHFGGIVSEKQLVAMATELPARIAHIDDKAGSIRDGLYADLLVVEGDRSRPYWALQNAKPKDVQLVLIAGEPMYGRLSLLRQIDKSKPFEPIDVCGAQMGIRLTVEDAAIPFGKDTLQDIRTRLQSLLSSKGISLSPLFECGPRTAIAASGAIQN